MLFRSQNNTTAKSSPVQIGTSSWTQLALGDWHGLALRTDGGLFTWGLNDNGQLGNNNGVQTAFSSPAQVGTSSWINVSAGQSFSVAQKTDYTLWAWGFNTDGELGVNNTTSLFSSPVQVATVYGPWQFVAGEKHVIQVDKSYGVMYGHGLNTLGQLGLNNANPRSSPTQVASGVNYTYIVSSPTQIGSLSYKSVSAGDNITFAISTTNKLYSWGRNTNADTAGTVTAMLGNYQQSPDNATTKAYSVPFHGYLVSPVQIGTSNFIAVSAGTSHVGTVKFP